MKVFSFLIKEFFYGGHILTVGALAITIITGFLFYLDVSILQLLPIYFITQTIYYFDRYSGLKQDIKTNEKRSKHLKTYLHILPILITIYLVITILLVLRIDTIILKLTSLSIMFLGFLYGKYFKGLTKYIYGFKNFFVSIIWIYPVVYTLMLYSIQPFSYKAILFCIFIFIKSLIIQIYFDIKDLETDRNLKLKTIPILLGKQKTFLLLLILSILSNIPLVLGIILQDFPKYFISLVLLNLIEIFIFIKSKKRLEYYLVIVMSGMYLYLLLILLVGRFIYGI